MEENLAAAHDDFNKMDSLLGEVRQELEAARMQNTMDVEKHQLTLKKMETEQQIAIQQKVYRLLLFFLNLLFWY